MDNKTIVLDVMRDLGAREATELRKTASTLTGTEIIALGCTAGLHRLAERRPGDG